MTVPTMTGNQLTSPSVAKLNSPPIPDRLYSLLPVSVGVCTERVNPVPRRRVSGAGEWVWVRRWADPSEGEKHGATHQCSSALHRREHDRSSGRAHLLLRTFDLSGPRRR